MVFLIIVVTIILIAIAYKPKAKDSNYYSRHPELNRIANYHCREISKFNSFLNLGADKSGGLDTFSYKNRQVYLRTRKGKTLSGMLENITTTFVKYPRTQGGYFACEVKCNGRKIEFLNIDGLFSDEEYWDMWDILSHSGKVGGQGDYNSFKRTQEFMGTITNSIKHAVGIESIPQPNFKETIQDSDMLVQTPDISSRLKDAKELYDEGVLTQEEFDKTKAKLIDEI